MEAGRLLILAMAKHPTPTPTPTPMPTPTTPTPSHKRNMAGCVCLHTPSHAGGREPWWSCTHLPYLHLHAHTHTHTHIHARQTKCDYSEGHVTPCRRAALHSAQVGGQRLLKMHCNVTGVVRKRRAWHGMAWHHEGPAVMIPSTPTYPPTHIHPYRGTRGEVSALQCLGGVEGGRAGQGRA